jgi:sugar lactone lactonase YvrE
MGLLSRIATFFGRSDDDALSVPPMDGVFKPNTLLDSAEIVLQLAGIDNLAAADAMIYCSSGTVLHRIDPRRGSAAVVKSFDAPITAIATSPSGQIAIAIEKLGIELLSPQGAGRLINLATTYAACVTAIVFRDEDTIVFTVGSQQHAMSDWKRDLMSRGATGLVASLTLSTGKTEILSDKLAFPYGLANGPGGTIAVSESWRHRILPLRSPGQQPATALLADLPAYPARLASASDGGHWLALFAPRRQLTELVLVEDDYRLEMMATIPPEDWIGPDFGTGGSEEQPLQSGSVRQMGIMKPWAPSRSYGMVVRLDRDMTPIASYHSRADGRMHGIASVVELDGALYAASTGAGTLLRLDPASEALS